MKICVEVKKRKHFKKLNKVYNTEKIESEWFYDKNTVIDITDGCYYNLEYVKEENYKILTYKQWKAIMEGGNEDVCIKCKTREVWSELMEYYNVGIKCTFNIDPIKNSCIAVRGVWADKKWYKEEDYLILSYKEWKMINRGRYNEK